MGDKVNSGIGLSYNIASHVALRAGTTTLYRSWLYSPVRDLWFWRLGSIPASYATVESDARQMKQCWIPYIKNPKIPPPNCFLLFQAGPPVHHPGHEESNSTRHSHQHARHGLEIHRGQQGSHLHGQTPARLLPGQIQPFYNYQTTVLPGPIQAQKKFLMSKVTD